MKHELSKTAKSLLCVAWDAIKDYPLLRDFAYSENSSDECLEYASRCERAMERLTNFKNSLQDAVEQNVYGKQEEKEVSKFIFFCDCLLGKTPMHELPFMQNVLYFEELFIEYDHLGNDPASRTFTKSLIQIREQYIKEMAASLQSE